MRRGSTPKHIFTLSLDASVIAKVRVLYAQNGKLLFRKEGDQVTINGQQVIVELTQEDTLKFRNGTAEVQLRVNTPDGKSIPSPIYSIPVEQLLENEVFS